ncbi:hypothetical protein GI364_14850 [Alicyclobacillus sp. SO9]|nr:hypothetical protein GI364_14850 [Alicyclobacillus sp. SO9]
MMLGLLCITAGAAISLNPNISSIIRVSSMGVALVLLGLVVGILGFFKGES